MSKIHPTQSISYLLTKKKKFELKIKNAKAFINIHKHLMMFMKIQDTTIQQRKEKY